MNHVRNAVAATSTLVVPALLVALAVQPEFIGSKQDVVGSTDATRTMSAKPGNRQQRVRPVVPSFVTARDTINGFRILDSEIIGRIDRIAAQVPAEALAGHGSGRQVRYLAHAFMAGDDAPISYGLFHHPAAAMAFGCALDVDLTGRCEMVPVDRSHAAYEDTPGVYCVPMQIALGAPAYEPDRCEAPAQRSLSVYQ